MINKIKNLESWKMNPIIRKIVSMKNNSILKNSIINNNNKNFNFKNKIKNKKKFNEK
jgi:hypothetical protein|tara:strand:+ start:250 stop:420 length:171 start_codon:yes stop_codon:yes gene_type:complete